MEAGWSLSRKRPLPTVSFGADFFAAGPDCRPVGARQGSRVGLEQFRPARTTTPLPVPRTHLLLSLLVALLALACPAQESAPTDPVAKAIANWQSNKDAELAQRQSALQAMARHDAPAVTQELLAALAAAGDGPFAINVAQAIGTKVRPGCIPPLDEILRRDRTPLGLRNAAATAIARQGNQGVDLLLELLAKPGGLQVARDAAIDALGALRDERAFRGLAPLLLQGVSSERQRALRACEGAQGIAAVSAARVKLVGDPDLLLAATAWRQLAAEGHPQTRSRFDALDPRLGPDPQPAVRAEVVAGLLAQPDPAWHGRLLDLLATTQSQVQQVLRKQAAAAAKDDALVQFLASKGLADPRPEARDAALVILRGAPAAAVLPLVAKVREQLKKPTKANLDMAIGLHDLLAKDPTWKDDVLQLARSTDAQVRTVGLQLLLLLDSDAGVQIAQQSLDHKQWELRSMAYRYLARFRDPTSVPLLIARTDKEQGRLDAELSEALFLHTGTRCWKKAEWDAWWRKNKDGFALPAEASVRNAKAGAGGGGKTISYYDIPLSSHKASFLIDISGSMSAPVGTGGSRTRLDEAKRQMQRAVEALPEVHAFNLITYESGVQPLWDRLRKATAKNKQEALARVAELKPMGGTNIFDALEMAFRDPEVDTIYLMTDGQPSAGRIVDVNQIADEVRRWNVSRQIVIHGVSVGLDSALLKRLAAESGGTYVYVR